MGTVQPPLEAAAHSVLLPSRHAMPVTLRDTHQDSAPSVVAHLVQAHPMTVC